MKKYEDLTGRTFGRLTVIKEVDSVLSSQGYKIRKWLCRCECGQEKIIREIHLKSGHTKSCGCILSEKSAEHCRNTFSKPNVYEIKDDCVVGLSNNGDAFFVIDKEDYERVKKYTWSKNDKGYFLNRKGYLLHRFIKNETNENIVIDHINHLKYDNRKSNLRSCTQAQNSYNSKLCKRNTSGKTGVQWMKDRGLWRASITYLGKKIYLGDYSDIKDAISARTNAEDKYFKEFSYDNSIKLTNRDGRLDDN